MGATLSHSDHTKHIQQQSDGQQKQLVLSALYQVLSTNHDNPNNMYSNTDTQDVLDTLSFLPFNDYVTTLKNIQQTLQHSSNEQCTLTHMINMLQYTTVGDVIQFTATLLTFLSMLNNTDTAIKTEKENTIDDGKAELPTQKQTNIITHDNDHTIQQHTTHSNSSYDKSQIAQNNNTNDNINDNGSKSNNDNNKASNIKELWNSIDNQHKSQSCVIDPTVNAHDLSYDLLHTAKALQQLTTRLHNEPIEEFKRNEQFDEMDDEVEIQPITVNQLTQAYTSLNVYELGTLLKTQRTVECTPTQHAIKSPHIQPLPMLRLQSQPNNTLDLDTNILNRKTSSPYILPISTYSPKQCSMLPSPLSATIMSPLMNRQLSLRRRQSISSMTNQPTMPSIELTQYWSSDPCDLYIRLAGQSMIQYDIRLYERGQYVIDEMVDYIRSDISFTEIETAIVNSKHENNVQVHSNRNNNPMFFHAAEPHVLDILQALQYNIIEAANNHVGDLGDAGLLSMLEELRNRKISFAGIGENIHIASSIQTINTKAHKPYCNVSYTVGHIAFASKVPKGTEASDYNMGVHVLDMYDIEQQILNSVDTLRIWSKLVESRNQYDIIIAYHHNHYWEKKQVNEEGKVMGWRLEFARRCIDFGANIYIAHGAPRLQGIEIYKSCPIFYCMGNFIFQTKTAISFYTQEVWQSVIVDIQYHCNNIYHNNCRSTLKDSSNITGSKQQQLKHTVNPDSTDENSKFRSFTIRLIPIVLNEIGDQDCHLQTRGLPSRANYNDSINILQRLQILSAEFGTIINIDDSDNDNVVGYVYDGKTADTSIDNFETHILTKHNRNKSMQKQNDISSNQYNIARPKSYGHNLTNGVDNYINTQCNDNVNHDNHNDNDDDNICVVDSYGRLLNSYKQFKSTLRKSQSNIQFENKLDNVPREEKKQ